MAEAEEKGVGPMEKTVSAVKKKDPKFQFRKKRLQKLKSNSDFRKIIFKSNDEGIRNELIQKSVHFTK